MNNLNVQQTGGFPLETDTLNFMQEAYKLMQILGFISGSYTIISGCSVVGGTTKPGTIFVNGEILPMMGGATGSHIVIVQNIAVREFEDGQSRQVYYDRFATFGSGEDQIAWDLFKRPKTTTQLTELLGGIAAVPVGFIGMWAGNPDAIPVGWALCNGSNGTPDLRKRFIVGYDPDDSDYNAITKQGGLKDVILTEAQMPSHNHDGSTGSGGAHTHGYQKSVPGRGYETRADDYPHSNYQNAQTTSAGAHSHNFTTNPKGGGQAHENRPPYYTLAFIQFKGI